VLLCKKVRLQVSDEDAAALEFMQGKCRGLYNWLVMRLRAGENEQGRFYHVGGFKGYQWYNKQLDKIRSKRDRCKKQSRRSIRLSQVYQRVSAKKRNKQRDCLHKASHLIAHRLVESTVVIGEL
jgi:putative transposase